jgi:predicted ATPase
MRRIVLTGGPGSGKTVIAALLARQCPDRFVCIPEAASQVYAELGTRWDRLDDAGRRDLQRRIYRLQRAQEEQFADDPSRIMLLDRGTVDGSAYWPDGFDAYWLDLGTTREVELARYDAVIWLQTAAILGLYDGSASNACRSEDAAGAVETGQRLLQAWEGHPGLVQVGAFVDLNEKLAEVSRVVDAWGSDT